MAFENRQEEGVFNLRKKGKTSSVDWTKLPSELLVEIIEKHLVSSIDDYAAVSSVCRSWRKAAVDGCDRERLRQIWGGRQMPWLLLTDGNQEILNIDGPYARLPSLKKQRHDQTRKRKRKRKTSRSRSRSVLNLVKNKKYKVNFPQGYGRSCWGSSHGWILTHDIDTRNMYLFNPLTKTRLDLPCETTFPKRRYLDNYFVDKVAIFKDNHAGGLVVVLVYRTTYIAFAKPGDAEWSEISTQKDYPRTQIIEDVLYRVVDGVPTLFFMDYDGDLGYYRLDQQQQQKQQRKLTWYRSKLELLQQFWFNYPNEYSYNVYLVNSPSGEYLLMVLRFLKLAEPDFNEFKFEWCPDPEIPNYDQDKIIRHYKTVNFKVYKFLFDANRWEELEDLQDVSIFVGNNAAMSVSATHSGCQPNCIYFTDDNTRYYSRIQDRLGGHDMGVFRINDKCIKPFDVQIDDALTRSSYCCPFWFCPAV